MIPGAESNATALSFRWNVTAEDKRTMDIQMFFDNPFAVSSNPIPDKVRVTFNDPKLWIGADGLLMTNNTKVIERFLPTQMFPGGAGAAAAQTMTGAASSAKAVVIGNFIFNLLMSASLNQLWSMINT